MRTPHLDRLCREGTTLYNAFTVSPLCTPSRTSFFTGNYPHVNGSAYNHERDHLAPQQCSFLRALKDAGYENALAGKNHTFQESVFHELFDYREQAWHWGKTHGHVTDTDREVAAYLHADPRPECASDFAMLEGVIPGPMPFAAEGCVTAHIGDDAVSYLRDVGDKPFCLQVMFGDPHWPNVAPEPYYSMYDPADVQLEAPGHDFAGQPFKHFVQSRAYDWHRYTDAQKRRVLATYYGQITFCDDQVGRVLAELERGGKLDDTLVLFTSDHGGFGGRFGLTGKTAGFNDTLVRVPAILRGPGVPAGATLDGQVSNIDFLPTLFDLAGLPVPGGIQGRSFRPLLEGAPDVFREAVYAEVNEPTMPPPPVPREEFDGYAERRRAEAGSFWFGEYVRKGRAAMVRADGWKYVHYAGDFAELYDLAADPWELHNLAADPAHAAKRIEMHGRLTDWLLHEPWEAYLQAAALR